MCALSPNPHSIPAPSGHDSANRYWVWDPVHSAGANPLGLSPDQIVTLEVLGKAPLAMSSGWIAEQVGPAVSFGVAVLFAAGWVVLLVSVRDRLAPSTSSAARG